MRWLAVILVVALALPVAAQQNVQSPSNPGGITYEEYERQVTGGSAPPPPGAVPGGQPPGGGARLGYTVKDDLREALGEAIYRDHMALLDYNRRVFEWQMTSTMVSFWMVIALVVAGLAFAGVQFWRAMKATAGDPGLNTDLELSSKGLKVSSPVLGVIILTISLGFFYLYLRHVYPIEQVRGAGQTPAMPEAAAEE